MFVTLLYCTLEINTGYIWYSRAGHLPPIILDQNGEIVKIQVDPGQPLGVLEGACIDQEQILIPEDGLVLLYSDGVYEAQDANGEVFGMKRIIDELRTHMNESAQAICDNLWQAVGKYSGDIPHQDDFTAIVVKRGG